MAFANLVLLPRSLNLSAIPARFLGAGLVLSSVILMERPLLRTSWLGRAFLDSPFNLIFSIGVIIGMSVLMYVDPRVRLRLFIRTSPMWFLIGLMAVSALWSVDVRETLQQFFLLLASWCLVFYATASISWQDMVKALIFFFCGFVIMSVLTVVLAPGIGVQPEGLKHAGQWRGLNIHKNILSSIAIYGFAVLIIAFLTERRYRALLLFHMLVSLMVVFFSESGTGLIMLVLISLFLAAVPLLRTYLHLRMIFILMAFTLVALMLYAFVANLELISTFFGRSGTLSGRTTQWAFMVPYFYDRLWFGYGFDAFWMVYGDIGYAFGYERRSLDTPAIKTAHSAVLELILDGGILALSLWFITVVQYCNYAFRMATKQGSVLLLLPLAILMIYLIQNSINYEYLGPFTINFVIYGIFYIMLVRGDYGLEATGEEVTSLTEDDPETLEPQTQDDNLGNAPAPTPA